MEDDIDLGESRIVFDGEDSLVFLRSQAKRKYKINILIHNNSTCHIGKNNTMTEQLIINIGERKHVFLGNDVMCAAGVLIRTIDWHMIYSVKDKKRLNLSKSVFIGDHVWLYPAHDFGNRLSVQAYRKMEYQGRGPFFR